MIALSSLKQAPSDSTPSFPRTTQVDFVKIDVEGAELLVFEGAVQLLRRERPVVVFEHGTGSSEYYESGLRKVYEVLANCGLKVSLLENYLRRHNPLSANEFIREYGQGTNYYFVGHP
jgi:hypothetical protein